MRADSNTKARLLIFNPVLSAPTPPLLANLHSMQNVATCLQKILSSPSQRPRPLSLTQVRINQTTENFGLELKSFSLTLSTADLSQYYPSCMLQIAQSLSQLWIRQGRMPTLSAQPKLQATKQQPPSLSRKIRNLNKILLDYFYRDSARTNSG